jgi:hypothetical protein
VAGLALAKYLEHRARDLPAAEEVTRRLLVRCPDRERIHLEHRLARIVRKSASGATGRPRRSRIMRPQAR